jgi:hypothetical protein
MGAGPNTRWSGVHPIVESHAKSIGLRPVAISGRPTVVDFVAHGSTWVYKLHQVLGANLLILREGKWVGHLVPNRFPEPFESC